MKVKKILSFVLAVTFTSGLIASKAWGLDPKALPFAPLPEQVVDPNNPITPEKVVLGKKLFFETKLSLGQDISCNSCHNLDSFGVDNKPTSPGHKGQLGNRNSPSVYNAALHFAQFWDGRAANVEEQALGPVLNPKEMAMPKEEVVMERLQSEPEYVSMFIAAFPGEEKSLTFKNMGRAIGAFERTLLTPSRFDKYLAGDEAVLSAQEKKGLETFVSVGCTACHSGVGVGGGMFQKLGLVKPFETKDEGRFEVTKNPADKYFFKVPSLRNIVKTGPYFHDGSVKTLEEAVRLMGEHQLGRKLSNEQIADIIAFLGTLTGEVKK